MFYQYKRHNYVNQNISKSYFLHKKHQTNMKNRNDVNNESVCYIN